MLHRILIAVDGSPGGNAATRLGADIAARYGAEVVLVHVSSPPAVLALGGTTPVDALDDLMLQLEKRAFAEAGEILDAAGVSHTDVALVGSPARRIVEEAEQREADLVVIGHRGLSAVERFLMGSVSTQIAHRATCAVLIAPVPPEAENEDQDADQGTSSQME